MSTLFGQQVDPEYDEAKDERFTRVAKFLFGGLIVSLVYLLLGLPFPTEVFQGLVATILPYGSSFYVDRQTNAGQTWFWKAVLVTLPIHAIYLVAIFSCDAIFPEFMMKAVVFIPVLAVGFGIESALIFDRIVDHFRPPSRPTLHESGVE